MNELLKGIRVVKTYAWEEFMKEKVGDIRTGHSFPLLHLIFSYHAEGYMASCGMRDHKITYFPQVGDIRAKEISMIRTRSILGGARPPALRPLATRRQLQGAHDNGKQSAGLVG